MLLCVLASGPSLISPMQTVLRVVAALVRWLMLAVEGGQIPTGVKERVRLLRFSSREAEPAGSCSVGFASGLPGSQGLGA